MKILVCENGTAYYRDATKEEIERFESEKVHDTRTLEDVQSEKLAELSTACGIAIDDGVVLITEDGIERHFAGKEEDQISLEQVMRACRDGAPGWLYQSEGEQGKLGECFWLTAADATMISNALAIDKTQKRTYNKELQAYVLSLTTVEEVQAVQWGQPLTGQWLDEYNAKIGLLTPIIESMGGIYVGG